MSCPSFLRLSMANHSDPLRKNGLSYTSLIFSTIFTKITKFEVLFQHLTKMHQLFFRPLFPNFAMLPSISSRLFMNGSRCFFLVNIWLSTFSFTIYVRMTGPRRRSLNPLQLPGYLHQYNGENEEETNT